MSLGESASSRQEGEKLAPLKCRDGSRPNILLAEDSPAARVLTGALLRRIGCDVDAAEHGEEALSFIQNSDYDLVLMDIEMPVMDGVVAAREIRTMGGTAAKTPIVALSAFLADTKKSSHWQAHFDVALSKPAGKHQLHATIGKVLNFDPSKSRWSKGAFPGQSQSSGKTDVLVDDAKLERVLENIKTEDQILLLETVSTEIARYVVELGDKYKCSDDEGMLFAVHKLRGLSASFATVRLYGMAVSLKEKISNSSKSEREHAISALRKCANATATMLLEKSQELREASN